MIVKRLGKCLFLLIFLSLVTSCASIPRSVDHKNYGQKLAIVPIIYEDLSFIETGFTVFNNFSRVIPNSNWDVNHAITQIAESELSDEFQTSIVNEEHVRNHFRVMHNGTKNDYHKRLYTRSKIKEFAQKRSVDLLLVILPTSSGDVFFKTNQLIGSHGIYQRSSLASTKAITYITFGLYLYDGRTGEKIAIMHGHDSVENSFVISKNHVLTEEAINSIQKNVNKLYSENVPHILKAMKLSAQ